MRLVERELVLQLTLAHCAEAWNERLELLILGEHDHSSRLCLPSLIIEQVLAHCVDGDPQFREALEAAERVLRRSIIN